MAVENDLRQGARVPALLQAKRRMALEKNSSSDLRDESCAQRCACAFASALRCQSTSSRSCSWVMAAPDIRDKDLTKLSSFLVDRQKVGYVRAEGCDRPAPCEIDDRDLRRFAAYRLPEGASKGASCRVHTATATVPLLERAGASPAYRKGSGRLSSAYMHMHIGGL